VVLIANRTFRRRDVRDGVHLDLLLLDATGARRVIRYRILGVARGDLVTNPRKADAHARRDAACASRVATQIGIEVRRDRGPNFFQYGDASLVDRQYAAALRRFGTPQRGDRAVELLADVRRVEVAQHQAGIVAKRTHETRFPADVDQKP